MVSRHNHADHDHTRLHGPKNFGFAFAVGTLLNVGLVAAQFLYGIHAHSIALIADAGHNLGDALGLLLAWGAYILARREPTERCTYGFRSASILAALVNAAILLIATGAIVWEAMRRFAEPPPVAAPTVMIVAAIAIAVNLVSAWLLHGGEHDLNIRSAFMHLLADAAVSLGVVAAGGVILLSGWYWVDPVVSLFISLVIVWGTWDLLRNAVSVDRRICQTFAASPVKEQQTHKIDLIIALGLAAHAAVQSQGQSTYPTDLSWVSGPTDPEAAAKDYLEYRMNRHIAQHAASRRF